MKIIRLFLVLSMAAALTACAPSPGRATYVASSLDGKFTVEWMDLVCRLIRDEVKSPLEASRVIAYSGVALYESCLPGMTGYRSLSGQLNGMPPMPLPDAAVSYDWPTVVSAAMSETLRGFFEGSEKAGAAIKRLKEGQLAGRYAPGEIRNRSEAYGKSLAGAVLTWASADGFKETRSLPYTPPAGAGMWTPTPPAFNPPLEPHWGSLRAFVPGSLDAGFPPAPVPYSADKDSAFYREAMAVYQASKSLTDEEIATALFWADDPGRSFTPAGHWLSIANQLVVLLNLQAGPAAELYALAGIASADAFISCWHTKFLYNVQRPVTYINANIDPGWQSALFTPSFPEYTAAHSVVSEAIAAVLDRLLGEVRFTDNSYPDSGMPPRVFNSFEEAAREGAMSRLYGGIHYPFSIQQGLEQGKAIGENTLSRVQTKTK
jgi:hypothetical protein